MVHLLSYFKLVFNPYPCYFSHSNYIVPEWQEIMEDAEENQENLPAEQCVPNMQVNLD